MQDAVLSSQEWRALHHTVEESLPYDSGRKHHKRHIRTALAIKRKKTLRI